MLRTLLHAITIIVGYALVVYGSYLIYPPAAFIVGGVLAIVIGVANKG